VPPPTQPPGGRARLIHLITPGDHYSPSTGSAIPTVVHGLSAATPPGSPRPAVLVARGTYADRYGSADALEYAPTRGSRLDRTLDAALSRLALPRVQARRSFAAAVAGQGSWEPAVVVAHNAPQAVSVVDRSRHAAVLYAHNEILRTYARRESSRVLGTATAIVCVSDFLAERMADRVPAGLRSRLTVVHNGVDVGAFDPGKARRRGDRLHVMFLGRMIPDKGADVLVDAVRRLHREDIRLTLIGSSGFGPEDPLTPFETEIRRAAAALPGPSTVRSFVPRPVVPQLLRTADIVVAPSRWPDPSPLTVLEGMAAGAVVVGSTAGGIPELLGDAGVAVPAGDADALAQVLEALANDEALLERTRVACRQHATANDWSVARRRLTTALGAFGLDV